MKLKKEKHHHYVLAEVKNDLTRSSSAPPLRLQLHTRAISEATLLHSIDTAAAVGRRDEHSRCEDTLASTCSDRTPVVLEVSRRMPAQASGTRGTLKYLGRGVLGFMSL